MGEGLITAVSYSRIKDYEKCPLMLYKKSVEKASTEHMDRAAADRGTQIHGEAEAFTKGEGDFTANLAKYADYFQDLKLKYENGTAVVEEDWGFNQDWGPTGWWDDDVWMRMKLDNFIMEDESAGTATDYKTGKKFGNEVSHNQQGQLYALGSFMRYPELEVVNVEFLYLDIGGKPKPKTYTREKAMKFLPHWTKRGRAVTDATDFPPKPNKVTCMWCPFGPQNGDSSCDWGV